MPILLLLLCVASVVVMLSMPTQVLTCQANLGQDSVQCEANRIRWWRSQTQFHLSQVQQATLGNRQVRREGSRTTDYYMMLEASSGQQHIFPARAPDLATDLVTQERQIAQLNQYLANPQPAPWVYRFPSRLGSIVMWSIMLCFAGIPTLWLATLWLRKPTPYMIELDRTPGRMVVTSRYLNGRQHFTTYRLDNIARVWVTESRGPYGASGCNTWVLLKSGIQVDLIGSWHSGVEQHRAAELIEQFLRH